jgi:hypothetical protein
MVVLNLSLLNMEYTLINLLKALASMISMYGLHVSFLSKITPRYFTLFTNGMWFNSMREVDCPSLLFNAHTRPPLSSGRVGVL